MKYIFSFFAFFFLASCALGQTGNIPKSDSDRPSPTEYTSGALETSSTGNIQISLSSEYRYLDSENKSFSSGSFREIISKNPYTIVYFYPKDGTPNCTIQALDFSLMKEDFAKLWYGIIGVSKDDIDAHLHFAERNELRINLLSDSSGQLLKEFWNEWPLAEYGNGHDLSDIIRSTFIIDREGNPIYAFRDITAKWHARRIYELISGSVYIKS
jgi:thioredoxin-dependent peroxiredoxin